jgi:hypothetical protein
MQQQQCTSRAGVKLLLLLLLLQSLFQGRTVSQRPGLK